MAAAMPLGTVRQVRRRGRNRPARKYVKVSHHGRWKDRWVLVDPIKGGIRETLKRPEVEQKRKQRQRAAVRRRAPKRNRIRARASRATFKPTSWYAVVHGIPATREVRRILTKRSRAVPPLGLIVMLPCRTKAEAVALGQQEEYGGVPAGVAKGEWILGDPDTMASLLGYERYVPYRGQAWVQKRTLDKQQAEGSQCQQ